MAPSTKAVKKSDAPYSLPILELIKTSQLQNGLRHGDYQRYRQYCARRLRRLRKSIKFTHGKSKSYIKKQMTVSQVSHVRSLYIPLYNAERAWSYAMQLRNDEQLEIEEHGVEDASSRLKFHLAARLTKAVYWASQLLNIVKTVGDAKTCLEAEAYASYMAGSLALHREEWEDASKYFRTAETIYKELSSVGTLESRDVIQTMLDEIQPYLRYCEYNVKSLTGKSTDENSLADVLSTGATLSSSSFLQSKLDKVLSEAASKKASESQKNEVEFRGKRIAVENQELYAAILRPQEHIALLESSGEDDSRREKVYLDILKHFDFALRLLRSETEKYEGMKRGELVDAQLATLESLENYLRYNKLSTLVDRNLLLFDQLQKRNVSGWKQSINDNDDVQSQDLIHILDMVYQNLQDLMTIPGTADDASASTQCHERMTICSALRCYYLAECASKNKDFDQAFALYDRSLHLCNEASSFTQKTRVEGLAEYLSQAKVRTLACGFLNQKQEEESLVDGVKSVSLKEEGHTTKTYLMDRLQKFDGGNPNTKFDLLEMPPKMTSVAAKPLFFDMAFNELRFPDDLEDRCLTPEELEQKAREKEAAEKASSTGGGFFGWFKN